MGFSLYDDRMGEEGGDGNMFIFFIYMYGDEDEDDK
jgi:hypothetical protein